jgi:uncharacterized protein YkwD
MIYMGIASQCVHGAGMCFIPHERNNFHPFALNHGLLGFVSALLIASKALALTLVAITPTSADLSTITVNRIVQLTNAERTKAGLNELTVNSQLSVAAKQKGEHMLSEDYFAHISPSGVTPWFWMSKNGYSYSVAGENLAIDFTEAEDVVSAWIASPTHKENMLLPQYTETGVAVVTGEFQGGTSIVVVHMFGKPSVAAAQTTIDTNDALKTQATGDVKPPAVTTPTPVPSIAPADNTPPAVPRIAFEGGSEVVGKNITVDVSGEAGSVVKLLVNGLQASEFVLPGTGQDTIELDISDEPDGEIAITAFATDGAGNISEKVSLNTAKDTTGPLLAKEDLSLVLLPLTDFPQISARVSSTDASSFEIGDGEGKNVMPVGESLVLSVTDKPISFSARDEIGNTGPSFEVALAPAFAQEGSKEYIAPPAKFSRATRWLAAVFSIIILILLSIAVIVRIRIQRPALIAHAGAVAILAFLVFLI